MKKKIVVFDFEDGNGPVPAHRHKNPDGSVGEWVANTAKVEASAWVYGDAQAVRLPMKIGAICPKE